MTAPADAGALYAGAVYHRRLKPVEHTLRYRVFSMLVDLDRLSALDAGLKLFSRNRFNLFSFHDRDFGTGADDLAADIRAAFAEAGVDAAGRIELLCYPRILGYAFNPLAVYYAHDGAGALSAILYEVRNTFGGKHSYLIPVEQTGDGPVRQQADKKLYVSPFMEMATRYRFTMAPPGEEIAVVIRQEDAEGPVLDASFAGRRRAMTDRTLLEAFFAYPLMTLKVIAGIHFEALKLFLKGVKYVPRAPDPAEALTIVRAAPEDATRAA